MILAAFRPATKAKMIDEGLVMSTLQMVFRRSLQDIRSNDAYHSGAAHPTAFDAGFINLARMVSLANSIKPEDIPPMVRIRIESGGSRHRGRRLFRRRSLRAVLRHPGAIARIWRSKAGRRSMVVTAEDTRDPNGRELEVHLGAAAGRPGARDHRAARRRPPRPDHPRLAGPPADLGQEPADLVAGRHRRLRHNGVHDSAPAILSWYFPPEELRRYAPGPDGAPRMKASTTPARSGPGLTSTRCCCPAPPGATTTPMPPTAPRLGWTRTRAGGGTDGYTPSGDRILTAHRRRHPPARRGRRLPAAPHRRRHAWWSRSATPAGWSIRTRAALIGAQA